MNSLAIILILLIIANDFFLLIVIKPFQPEIEYSTHAELLHLCASGASDQRKLIT